MIWWYYWPIKKSPIIPAQILIENGCWYRDCIIPCGISLACRWLLWKLIVSFHINLASSVNKTTNSICSYLKTRYKIQYVGPKVPASFVDGMGITNYQMYDLLNSHMAYSLHSSNSICTSLRICFVGLPIRSSSCTVLMFWSLALEMQCFNKSVSHKWVWVLLFRMRHTGQHSTYRRKSPVLIFGFILLPQGHSWINTLQHMIGKATKNFRLICLYHRAFI